MQDVQAAPPDVHPAERAAGGGGSLLAAGVPASAPASGCVPASTPASIPTPASATCGEAQRSSWPAGICWHPALHTWTTLAAPPAALHE
ncbi:MAG: hypothetical protein E6J78_19780 [Deltaproteobacteria bacterium]|nr:MAG: hypothetical protein E6J78_19780 [Deltaproteobacteria bacterium]